jgi:hypothetical protein
MQSANNDKIQIRKITRISREQQCDFLMEGAIASRKAWTRSQIAGVELGINYVNRYRRVSFVSDFVSFDSFTQ